MKISKFFLAILILAFFLRFYKLGEIPPSLNWDETSNAYNAYSILKTGRDEYGSFLPLTNRSFDDYKPPMYMYLSVPSIAMFGLTPFAARLPSAILGFLTVPIVYLLVKKLMGNYMWKFKIGKLEVDIPTLAMLGLAFSPWHIQFSRSGFESNVGLFFVTAAILAFFYGQWAKKWAIACAVLFGLCFYTYHTQRIFTPLIFAAALVIYKKEVFTLPKKFLAFLILVIFLTILPLVLFTPTRQLVQRLEVASNNANVENAQRSAKFISQDDNSIVSRAIHNQKIMRLESYIGNYFSHYDVNFLFIKGDGNFRHHVQDIGLLYIFELSLILIGLYHLVKNRDKNSIFLLSWLTIAPIAASPADPAPHANRSLPMVVPLVIISAIGFVQLFSTRYLESRGSKIVGIFTVALFVLMHIYNYYTHYAPEKASFWQYGYKEAVLESEKSKDKFSKILVDDSIEQAYIFWLFNLQFDPKTYQGGGNSSQFENYYFNSDPTQETTDLFVSDPGKFPDSFKVIKTIYFPDGQEAIKIGHHQ